MGQCLAYLQRILQGKGSYTEDTAVTPGTSKDSSVQFPKMDMSKLDIPDDLLDHILGTVFGNCIGDAIGLITEFLIKSQVTEILGSHKHFEYRTKEVTGERFLHQYRFPTADWTDDSDQMMLILQSLIDNSGKIVPVDFGRRLVYWRGHGFPELGDTAGMGIGQTTWLVLAHKAFETNPHQAAYSIWLDRNCTVAPNGGVMRTSVLGIHNHHDIERVKRNTLAICKVTHADPRCIASCIAVTTCIAMMLQGKHRESNGSYDVQALTDDAYEHAKPYLTIYQNEIHTDPDKTIPEFNPEDLHQYMNMQNLEDLKLDENGKIGYTYKCLGAGFWALRQKDFRKAIEALTREGGDADTNCAVAGALLGCKLGYKKLPKTWKEELKHKNWLEGNIYKYLNMKIMNADDTDVSTIIDPAQEVEEKMTDVSTSHTTDAGKQDEAAASADQNPSTKEGASESSTVDSPGQIKDQKRTASEKKSEKDDQNKKEKEEI